MVEDSIQMPDTMTCGLFKIYFCENVFNQNEKGKTQKNKKLTKKNNRNVTKWITYPRQRKKQIVNGTIH